MPFNQRPVILCCFFFPLNIVSGASALAAHHAADGVGLTRHSWFPVAF